MTDNKALVLQEKTSTIRKLLTSDAVKKQLQLALPKHLPVDRLLRVALTSIQRNPRLLDCTQRSLLACVMTAAQLGLEPDQFLGQCYLVPFRNKRGFTECQLIPGYRGYIALARRSGEVQSVSSQVVYMKDYFELQFGLEEKLVHVPADDADRGEVKGAYVVFKYKDGSHSFDYMPRAEIDRIRKRSKSADDGPWVTDYAEMSKKTVIKRHAKLAPLSVEFAKAATLEDRAMAGESQLDLIDEDEDGVIDVEANGDSDEAQEVPTADVEAIFAEEARQRKADPATLEAFLLRAAETNKSSVEEVKAEAVKRTDAFWKAYGAFAAQEAAAAKKKGNNDKAAAKDEKAAKKDEPVQEAKQPDYIRCPNDDSMIDPAHCGKCKNREGCPAWPQE